MTVFEQAQKLLSRAPLENASSLCMLSRGTVESVSIFGRSLLLYDRKSDLYVLIPADEDGMHHICDALPECCDVFLSDEAYGGILRKSFDFEYYMPCTQYVYAGKMPEVLPCAAEIRPLVDTDAAFVTEHYSNRAVARLDYIRDRIRDGVALGAFYEKACAGFILTHSEDSMGMLDVLPEYQRGGIAYALERRLIEELLKLGITPYCHIKFGNTASERLQQKLGLVKSRRDVSWAGGKKRVSGC